MSKSNKNSNFTFYVLMILGALGALVFLVTPILYLFFVQPLQINGQSMFPQFSPGEYYIANKFEYLFSEPKRGDVVVFHAPEASGCPRGTGCDFISRVVGLPGETISFQNGVVILNNQPLDETTYLQSDIKTNGGPFLKEGQSFAIPAGEYVVMGDNRPYSSDSRSWGTVPKEDIFGKMWFCYAYCK